jgi:hypothetical protein
MSDSREDDPEYVRRECLWLRAVRRALKIPPHVGLYERHPELDHEKYEGH